MTLELFFSQRIWRVLLFIEKNFQTNISLKQVSLISNLSSSYMDKVFKREIGLPIKKFLILKRLIEAACVLRSGKNFSITSVCLDTGFNDLSNFIRQFKRHIGCSPIRFKNCYYEPRTCGLRRRSFIYLASRKITNLEKALGVDMSKLCFMNRTRKTKK